MCDVVLLHIIRDIVEFCEGPNFMPLCLFIMFVCTIIISKTKNKNKQK